VGQFPGIYQKGYLVSRDDWELILEKKRQNVRKGEKKKSRIEEGFLAPAKNLRRAEKPTIILNSRTKGQSKEVPVSHRRE